LSRVREGFLRAFIDDGDAHAAVLRFALSRGNQRGEIQRLIRLK
jgi:hypothetical protein